MVTAEGSKEYIIMDKKSHSASDDGENIETIDFANAIKDGITTGEYKIVFKAYYNNTLVQTLKKTFIVTP